MKERGKVLVIEDDPNWQVDLRECLEGAGFFVEVVNDLDAALNKIRAELFHFITIDMQLKESTTDAALFEGWSLLKVIKKLRVEDVTPAMVITGFENEYEDLRGLKKLEAIHFMGKGKFDCQKFIEIVERDVEQTKLRFKNDHRGG